MHYALISFGANGTTHIRDFVLLKMSGLYREDNPSDSLSYRFLLCGINAYLYNLKTITVVKPQEEPDVLEFNSPQDLLLGTLPTIFLFSCCQCFFFLFDILMTLTFTLEWVFF